MDMQRIIGISACVLSVLATENVLAEEGEVEYGSERYELIVARSPFGADPMTDAEANDVAAAATLKTLEQQLRLCFVMESKSGEIRAGFQNLKARKGEPKSVVLLQGESFRALRLTDVNVSESTATLQYLGKPVTFELAKGKGNSAAAAAKPSVRTPTRPQQPQRRFGGGFRRVSPENPPQSKMEPEVPQITPEEQAQKQAEVRENLRQYQMEVIRAGMPPLPIPLTKEMDDQLVSEGVLPPSE